MHLNVPPAGSQPGKFQPTTQPSVATSGSLLPTSSEIPSDWAIGLSLPELGLRVYGRDASFPPFRNYGGEVIQTLQRRPQHTGVFPQTESVFCATAARRAGQQAGSIKMCQASPFSSLCLSFCLCKMRRAHSQRTRWSLWG